MHVYSLLIDDYCGVELFHLTLRKLNKKEDSIRPPQILMLDMDSPGIIASNCSSTTNQPQDRTSTANDVLDVHPISPSNSFGNISGLDSTFMGGIMVGPATMAIAIQMKILLCHV